MLRVCEGGGAQHTHALGVGQVLVALHGGGMGGGNERKVVRWWEYLRLVAVVPRLGRSLAPQLVGEGRSRGGKQVGGSPSRLLRVQRLGRAPLDGGGRWHASECGGGSVCVFWTRGRAVDSAAPCLIARRPLILRGGGGAVHWCCAWPLARKGVRREGGVGFSLSQ